MKKSKQEKNQETIKRNEKTLEKSLSKIKGTVSSETLFGILENNYLLSNLIK